MSLRGTDSGASSFPTLRILFRSITSIQEIVLFLSSLMALTAKDVIVMLQGCFLSLLYGFGPIAIVCGINEKSAQVTRGWLANTIQVASWSFFLRLTVRVWLELNTMSGATGQSWVDDFLAILTVNISFLILVMGTPIVAARLLSGGNLAAFGATAFGAVQSLIVAKTLFTTGQFANAETVKFKKASEEEQRSYFHHPIPATMTYLYERTFGRRVAHNKSNASPGAAKHGGAPQTGGKRR